MPDTHDMKKLIHRLSWFAAGAVVVIAATVGSLYLFQRRALRDLADSREFARIARNAAAMATDRETSIHAYLITRDVRSLARNINARAQLPRLLDTLGVMAARDEMQLEHLRAVTGALAAWDREFAAPAESGRLSREGSVLAGKPLFDVVRSRFTTLIAGADAKFAGKTARVLRIEVTGAAVVLGELLIFFGVLIYLIRGRLVAQAGELAHQQELLEQQAVELELQMQETESSNESLSESLASVERKDEELRGSLSQLERAGALLNSALASSPLGFAFWDCNLRFIKANKQLAASRGLAPEDFVGRTIADIAPDVAGQVQPILEEVIRSRSVVPNVDVTRNGNGDAPTRHNRVTFYPVTNSEGELLAVGAVIADVTESHHREERMRRSEERYRYIAMATKDVVYDWDIVTNAFEWSEGMEELFGYTRDDVEDSPNWIWGLVHPEDAPHLTDTFVHALESGADRWQLPYRLRRRDGKYASVEGRAHILRGADGKPVRVIGAISDRTRQQSLEEQLRQSQKMDAVGRLAGGIAHDFNNILTVIRMSSEFMLEDLPVASENRHEAGEILKAADRAAALTRQLLAFRRHQVLNPRVVVLNEVVEGLQGMLKRVVPENIAVATELASELDPIKADTGHLEQVILNLVINAADAIPDGGRLDIRTSNVEVDSAFTAGHLDVEPGSYVCLTVSDTGVGMDKDTVNRIFEPFFTTKAVGKGTGLGLATVHGIVTQTGGKVWVYSEPGQGTTFKIFIPVSEEIARPITPRSVKRIEPATETILLVEDEASTREAVERSLTRAGYRVLLASNGVEALGIAGASRDEIALVLTDSMMPEMGGLELVARLRETRPEIRVLLMSGYTEQAATSRFGLSEQPFIEKPFASADLLASIQRVLHGDESGPAD